VEGNPSAVALTENKIDVFHRGPHGELANSYWASGWSYGVVSAEKVVEGNPSAVALTENKIDVFHRGPHGELL